MIMKSDYGRIDRWGLVVHRQLSAEWSCHSRLQAAQIQSRVSCSPPAGRRPLYAVVHSLYLPTSSAAGERRERQYQLDRLCMVEIRHSDSDGGT